MLFFKCCGLCLALIRENTYNIAITVGFMLSLHSQYRSIASTSVKKVSIESLTPCSQMTHKGVTKSVSKFGGILFTPILYTVDVCFAAGPLKDRASLWSQNGHPLPPKPLQQPQFICQHIATAHFSQLTNRAPDIAHFFIACTGVKWVEY